jgi:hypothetical protein
MMHTWEVQQVGPEKTSAYPPDLRGMRYVTGSKQSASVCCVRVLNMVLSLKSPHHMQRGWLIRRQGPPPKQQLYHMHRGWLINRQGPPPTQQLYQQTLTCQSRRGRRPGPLHRPHRSWPSGLQHSMAAHRVVGHNGECTALDTPGPCMQLPLHTPAVQASAREDAGLKRLHARHGPTWGCGSDAGCSQRLICSANIFALLCTWFDPIIAVGAHEVPHASGWLAVGVSLRHGRSHEHLRRHTQLHNSTPTHRTV